MSTATHPNRSSSKKSIPYQMTVDFLVRNRAIFAIALLTRAAWEIVPMQVPIVAGAIVDGLNGKASKVYGVQFSPDTMMETVNFAGICLGVVAIVYSLTAYAYSVSAAYLGEVFVSSLRKKITDKVLSLPLSTQQKLGAGELLDRTLRDTGRLRKFIDQVVIRSATNVLRIGYPLSMLFITDIKLALMAISVLPVQWFVSLRLQQRLFDLTKQAAEAQSKLTLSVKETIDGAETVQSINGEQVRYKTTCENIDAVAALQRKSNRINALIRAVVWLSTATGVALVWWQGSLMVAQGALTVGAMVMFTGFMEFTYRPFRFFPKVVKSLEQGRASMIRIHEVFEINDRADKSKRDTAWKMNRGSIEFRDVKLSYRGKQVLHGINTKIEAGKLTAIVGPSGSGKSSLLRLPSRLYKKNSGEILVDDHPIDQISLTSLRDQITFVPQSSVVFSGTIMENLLIGNPEASIADVKRACVDGGAWEFIEQFPDGFDTVVGPDGIRLSGGETQRLALSRALLCNPNILLLDEPTSSLDARTQEQFMQTLFELRGRVTIVIVGHRLATFRNADHIVVVNEGRIIAEGTHPQLLAKSEKYCQLVETSNDERPSTIRIGSVS